MHPMVIFLSFHGTILVLKSQVPLWQRHPTPPRWARGVGDSQPLGLGVLPLASLFPFSVINWTKLRIIYYSTSQKHTRNYFLWSHLYLGTKTEGTHVNGKTASLGERGSLGLAGKHSLSHQITLQWPQRIDIKINLAHQLFHWVCD